MSFIADGAILSYVPEQCTRVDPGTASVEAAGNFNPNHTSYWTGKIGSMIPGLVLGGICAIGFVLLLSWICVRWCRRRKIEAAWKTPEGQQFLTAAEAPSDGGGGTDGGGAALASPPPAFQSPPSLDRTQRRWANIITASMLLLAVGTVAVGIWAMVESIDQTNNVISNFWGLVEETRDVVSTAQAEMAALSFNLYRIQPAAVVLRDKASVLVPALRQLGLAENDTATVLSVLTSMPSESIRQASSTINSTALPLLNSTIMDAIASVLDWEDPTMTIQDTWRFVILAVLFGLLILFVIVATAACFWMRFGRWASLLVALVWLLNAAVMLGGVGLLNGVEVISADGCLYTEDFIYRLVNTSLSGSAQSMVVGGMDYYFGVRNLTEIVGGGAVNRGADPLVVDAILEGVAGVKVNITDVLVKAQEVNTTLWAFANNPQFKRQLDVLVARGVVDGETMGAFVTAMDGVIGILNSSYHLVQTLRRDNVEPIYHGFKAYLCCHVNTAGYWCWVSWTVTGSLALAYCVAASARVIWQTVCPADRGWVRGWEQGAGAPPTPPPAPADGPPLGGAEDSGPIGASFITAKDSKGGWASGFEEVPLGKGAPAGGIDGTTIRAGPPAPPS